MAACPRAVTDAGDLHVDAVWRVGLSHAHRRTPGRITHFLRVLPTFRHRRQWPTCWRFTIASASRAR